MKISNPNPCFHFSLLLYFSLSIHSVVKLHVQIRIKWNLKYRTKRVILREKNQEPKLIVCLRGSDNGNHHPYF